MGHKGLVCSVLDHVLTGMGNHPYIVPVMERGGAYLEGEAQVGGTDERPPVPAHGADCSAVRHLSRRKVTLSFTGYSNSGALVSFARACVFL